MLQILKVPVEKEQERAEDDEIEMSLELSIGGSYIKSTKNPRNLGDEKNAINSDFFLEKRKEIQATRRQEARENRGSKAKKSNNLGFMLEVDDDDKLVLEAKRFQSRAEDREMRQKEDCEFSSRKKYGLNLSLCTKNDNNGDGVQGLYPNVQCGYAYPALKMMVSNNNGSLEQSSAAVSGYQSKGGSNSDSGGHSSPLGPRQLHNFPRKSPLVQPKVNHSSSRPELNHPESSPTPASSSILQLGLPDTKPETQAHSPSNESCNGLVDKPPKLPTNNLNATSIPRMPCVTTTGNGPNGKTINGILYQYTKTEVSIMCVCHGNSFSPAGFVEHAGSIDISHPLRHITIVPPRL